MLSMSKPVPSVSTPDSKRAKERAQRERRLWSRANPCDYVTVAARIRNSSYKSRSHTLARRLTLRSLPPSLLLHFTLPPSIPTRKAIAHGRRPPSGATTGMGTGMAVGMGGVRRRRRLEERGRGGMGEVEVGMGTARMRSGAAAYLGERRRRRCLLSSGLCVPSLGKMTCTCQALRSARPSPSLPSPSARRAAPPASPSAPLDPAPNAIVPPPPPPPPTTITNQPTTNQAIPSHSDPPLTYPAFLSLSPP